MAERPDPDTDRRNILPGEHAKPDGTWCPYLAPSNEAGVWVCMKCGNSGGVSTPDTNPNTLADRLDVMSRNGYNPDAHDDLRAAADGLRQYAAITAAIGDPDELLANAHYGRAANGHGDDLFATVNRITASLSPTPTPDRCPTCDSDDRTKQRVRGPGQRHCPNTWHKLTED
jgi:hypothetical protein